MSKSILYTYTPNELQHLLDTSDGYSDLLRKIGLNPNGGNPNTLKKIISEYGLDESKLNFNRQKLFSSNALHMNKSQKFNTEDIFNGKHPNYQSSKLLKRLVDEGYKDYKCEICGISEWMDKSITLQLHHKDDNHNNNKLENLQILCPNCHSQTNSYGGKSSKKSKGEVLKDNLDKPGRNCEKTKERKPLPISRDELKNKIRNNSFLKIGNEYGVSDNAIRKWCDRYNLPRLSRDIKSYSDEEWDQI